MEREVSEVDRRLILKRTYLDKITYYLTRNSTEPEELYALVRRFFAEDLKLDYEFTYEELSQELNKVFIRPKVKDHIDDFLIRLSESEYLEETALSVVGINSFLREFDEIIRNVIFDDQEVKEEEISMLQKVLNIKPKLRDKPVDVPGLKLVIEEINFYIANGQVDTAKKSYMDLSKAYERLSKNDKKILHEDMNDVYDKLQSVVRNPHLQTIQNEILNGVVKKLNEDIDETTFYITAGNFESAKNSYTETLKVYESLSAEDKKIIHQKLDETYKKLQAMSSKSKHVETAPKSLPDLAPILKAVVSGEKGVTEKNIINVKIVTDAIEKTEKVSPTEKNAEKDGSTEKIIQTEKSDSMQTSGSSYDTTQSDVSDYFNEVDYTPASSDSSSSSSNVSLAVSSNTAGLTTTGFNADVNARNIATNAAVAANAAAASTTVTAEGRTSGRSPVFSKTETGNSLFQAEEETDTTKTISIGFDNVPASESAAFQDKKRQDVGKDSGKDIDRDAGKDAGNILFSPGSGNSNLKISEVKKDVQIVKKDVQVPNLQVSGLQVPILQTTSKKPLSTPLSTQSSTQVSAILDTSKITSRSTSVLEIKSPTATETLVQFRISSNLNKMDSMLKKINDDILVARLENASNTYADALILYKSMNSDEKKQCYKKFYDAFKALDEEVHKKSLNEILNKHLSVSEDAKRPLASRREISDRDSMPKNLESLKISQETTLPVSLGNTPEITRIYELIEESYFNMSNGNNDLAMLKYFKALEFYRKLPVIDKRKLYSGLRELFVRLSAIKSVR